MLQEVGWTLSKPEDREYPVKGMPNNKGEGFATRDRWTHRAFPLRRNREYRPAPCLLGAQLLFPLAAFPTRHQACQTASNPWPIGVEEL